MGQLTFTIDGTVFGPLDNSAGRKAMEFHVDLPQQQITKFHKPGDRGSLIILNGIVHTKIRFRARYVGFRSTILSQFRDDRETWTEQPITVSDEAKEYSLCLLEGMERVGKPVGTGPNDFGYLDVVGVISWESR